MRLGEPEKRPGPPRQGSGLRAYGLWERSTSLSNSLELGSGPSARRADLLQQGEVVDKGGGAGLQTAKARRSWQFQRKLATLSARAAKLLLQQGIEPLLATLEPQGFLQALGCLSRPGITRFSTSSRSYEQHAPYKRAQQMSERRAKTSRRAFLMTEGRSVHTATTLSNFSKTERNLDAMVAASWDCQPKSSVSRWTRPPAFVYQKFTRLAPSRDMPSKVRVPGLLFASTTTWSKHSVNSFFRTAATVVLDMPRQGRITFSEGPPVFRGLQNAQLAKSSCAFLPAGKTHSAVFSQRFRVCNERGMHQKGLCKHLRKRTKAAVGSADVLLCEMRTGSPAIREPVAPVHANGPGRSRSVSLAAPSLESCSSIVLQCYPQLPVQPPVPGAAVPNKA